MDHAIIVAAGTGIEQEDLASFGDVVFGTLPQLKRQLIVAQRAGITRFTIITPDSESPLKDLIDSDKRIESHIEWHAMGNGLNLNSEPYLVLQSNLFTTPQALENFMSATSESQDEMALLVDTSKDAWIKADADNVTDLFSGGGRAVGAFIVSGELLEKSVANSMCLQSLVNELAGRDKVKMVPFSDSYWMRLDSGENSAKAAEDLLFAHVGKTATGWISRNINSQFSLRTSRQLIKTPLTPNMISVLINIIGMMSGPFYAFGHPVIGAVCMQIATILDRCDGEVARVRLMETKKGQWVDTISDQGTVLSFIIGVSVGYYLISGKPIALWLGALNLSIFIFFVIWSFYFLRHYTDSGSLVSYFEVDKLVDEKNSSFMRKLIKIVRPMSRRNFYSLGFLVVAIVGGYPWVLGFLSLALVLFLIHQIEDIIRLRRIKPDKDTLR